VLPALLFVGRSFPARRASVLLLDLPLITDGIPAERVAAVDDFVDPSLHRNRVGWQDRDVPQRVEALAEQAWAELQPLAAPGGDTAEAQAALDVTRDQFTALHAEAEAIAQSAITAAKRGGGKRRRGGGKAATEPAPLKVRLARRVPPRYRRRIRRALGR
jgi:hypothetical protein